MKFWFENLKGAGHSEHLGLDGRIISEWILDEWVGNYGLDSSDSVLRPAAGPCEHDDEP